MTEDWWTMDAGTRVAYCLCYQWHNKIYFTNFLTVHRHYACIIIKCEAAHPWHKQLDFLEMCP